MTMKKSCRSREIAVGYVCGSLIASLILWLTGHEWVASVFAGSAFGAVIIGFIQSRNKNRQKSSNDNEN